MNTTTVVTIFGILITILLSAAGVVGTWAALRVGKNAQTIKNYRSAADSWKERAEAQDAKITEQNEEISRMHTENTALRQEIAELRGQIGILTALVRSAISDLASSNTGMAVIDRLEQIIGRSTK